MKHPWERIPELANALGLILGDIGTIIIGFQIKNDWVIIVGFVSLLFFVLFFLVVLILLIRDYIKLLSSFRKKFLGIIPY